MSRSDSGSELYRLTTKLTRPTRSLSYNSGKRGGGPSWLRRSGQPIAHPAHYSEPRSSGFFSYCVGTDTISSGSCVSALRRPTTRT